MRPAFAARAHKRWVQATEPVFRVRGSAAMLEKACYQYRQSCPARSCELGCRKKQDRDKQI